MILRRRLWLLAPLALLTASCTEAPKEAAKKEPEKPPEPVAARYAFHQMFLSARTWSPDVMPVQMQSIPIPEVKAADGKFGAWQVLFASQSKQRAKTYTYSVVEAGGNLHKGVFAGFDENFSGTRGQAKPFNMNALKVDTDDALKTAIGKAGAFLKKNPDMPVMFLLEWTSRFPNPSWRVFWGESVSTSPFSVFIDASSGEFLVTVP